MSNLRQPFPTLSENLAKTGPRHGRSESDWRGKGQAAGPPEAGSRWLLEPEGQVAQLTGPGSSSDSVDHHRPWLLAPRRQVWSPTVVAGTLQVSAWAYLHRLVLYVHAEPRQLFSTLTLRWSHHLGIQRLQSPYCVPVSAM